MKCSYGCGKEAFYELKNGKMCCSKSYNSCPIAREKNSKNNKGKHAYWKGKKFSEKTKRKMRQSKIGEKNFMFNRKHTNKVKNIISEINKGKRCGHKNPNWKGGIAAAPYCDAWLDVGYKESIKERDGYICLNPECNDGRFLCIHHIDYNKQNCIPNNLITTCRSCNAKANFDREWHIAWYTAIIQKRYLTL